jgi:hypothetical protein
MSQRSTHRRRRRSRAEGVVVGRDLSLPDVLGFCGLGVASVAVAVSAWLHGGIVPQGRLVLQCGAILSALLCLLSGILGGRLPRRLPLVAVPLAGLALLVFFQLLPIWHSPVLSMSHAVFGELSGDLPATAGGGGLVRGALTQMPARTLLALNQLISTVLLGFVFFETTATARRAVWACVPLVVSGSAMAVTGLSGVMEVDELGFGQFVNPNNAAGWLLVCLSAALFCAGFTFSKSPPLIRPALGQMSRRERFRYALAHFARRIGEMTPLQSALCLSCVLLLCAVVGTLSRAGIAAGVGSVVIFFASRIRTNRWLMGVAGLSLLLLLSLCLLLLLDLDTPVISELQTLKDPVSASTIRLLHWSDSIRSVLDFPLFGSGFSAYRYSALPYSRHYTNNWFERADNYFLELLVECGLIGFFLGAFPGVLAGVYSLRMIYASEGIRSGVRRACGDWAGSAVLCLLLSLAGQNFFDFSIALGGVASGAAMLLCILERRYVEALNSVDGSIGRSIEAADGIWLRLQRPLPVLCVWSVLILGSCLLLRDCWYASVSQTAMLELRALILKPTPEVLVEDGDRLLAAADAAIAVRPHDESIQRYRVLLLKRLAEREMYLEAAAGAVLDPPQQRQLFSAVEFQPLAMRYLTSESSRDRAAFDSAARRALQKYPWTEAGRALLRISPLAVGIAPELIIAGVFEDSADDLEPLLYQSLFADPHSSDRLTALGEYLVRMGEMEFGLSVWAQSLAVSEKFRGGILSAAAAVFGMGDALELFAPETFDSAVMAARLLPAGELRTEVLADATRCWEEGGFRLTVPICIARADHLQMLGRTNEAVDFLAEQMLFQPGDLSLMLRHAAALEDAGRNSDAYDAWLAIREQDSSLPEIEKSLTRLARLPPTTVPEDAKVRALMEAKAKKAKDDAETAEKMARDKAREERAAKRGQSIRQKRPER